MRVSNAATRHKHTFHSNCVNKVSRLWISCAGKSIFYNGNENQPVIRASR